MNKLKILIAGFAGFFLASCTFNETLTLNEDGSGIMTIQMDASAMMAMMSSMGTEEKMKGMEDKIDTTFYFKDFLAEKKDSIQNLPVEQQNKLKKLEPYGVHVFMDAKENKLLYDVFVNFNDISQADNMFDVFNQINNTGVNSTSGSGSGAEEAPKQESIKVKYAYEGNIFKRDAYITDAQLHKAELDSLKDMEMMMGGALYKLTYTFPKTIKTVSQQDATLSQDRKTLYYQAEYLEYLKNPDVLDIEVVFDN
tara:strand:- start:46719 stop:47477 length:759 start_codon:yes stop_codon:yes gene_type:complete